MPDEPKPPVPAPGAGLPSPPLDRAALERVLARAGELQARAAHPPEGLSDTQLLEVGQEVGISAEHLRQALAEERTRVAVPVEHGVVGSWFGPTVATASRVVRGTPAQILSLLDGWMQREELLRPRRRFGERLTWEARRDFLGSIQAGFNLGGRAYALTNAAEVGATVVPVDPERVVVSLDADFEPSRRRSVAGAGTVAGVGVASGAGLVALGSMAPEVAGLLIGGAIGTAWTMIGGLVAAAVARAQRRKLSRAQLALEQILDRLEHGEIKAQRGSLLEFLSTVR
ncbi:MAG TPA: hypothetical protein VLE53_10320 [Gemmatimonadaceae bacterium]|nr:hypothetical protein [Gemmatimonadaceae bacterium]